MDTSTPLLASRGSSRYGRASRYAWTSSSSTRWTYAKRALAFAVVTQDGEGDGVLFLDRLPSAVEALAIRKCLGIAKVVEMAPDDLARRRERGAALTLARLAANERRQERKAA